MWKFITRLFASLTALIVSFTGVTGSLIGLTEGTPITATRHNYFFDSGRLLIGGYCNTPFDLNSVQYAVDAGLDYLVGFVNEEYLDKCDEYGLGMIALSYNGASMYMDVSQEGKQTWMSITEEAYKAHPALWGDEIIDEPINTEFSDISDIVDCYYANVPGRIPYVNLFPMYASSEQLGNLPEIPLAAKVLLFNTDYSDKSIDKYKRHISDYINTINTDYISTDIYPYRLTSTKKSPSTYDGWLRNLDILAEACREAGRDLWVIIQAFGYTPETATGGERYSDSVEQMRQQAYASLAFGAKNINYACFYTGWGDAASHMLDDSGNKTPTYYAVQKTNSELKRFADIYGDYKYTSTFMLNSEIVAGQKYGYLATENEACKPVIESNNGLLVGTFEKDGGKAYVITNMQEVKDSVMAAATLTVPDAASLTIYQQGQITTVNSGTVNLTLLPGEGVFVTAQ
jgi:hypothetical protein